MNPILRALRPERVERYRSEPYVVAADIYSAPQHVGRGGWTWYTGAAGWMYRVTLAHILGIAREGEFLRIDPCIPSHWREFDVAFRVPGAEYRIHVENPDGISRGVKALSVNGHAVPDGRVVIAPDSGVHHVRVLLGPV